MSKKDLEQRKKQTKEFARKAVAKSEVMNFRMDPDSIEKIYSLAERHRKNPGALVREWVMERLALEFGEGLTLEQRVTDLEHAFPTIITLMALSGGVATSATQVHNPKRTSRKDEPNPPTDWLTVSEAGLNAVSDLMRRYMASLGRVRVK